MTPRLYTQWAVMRLPDRTIGFRDTFMSFQEAQAEVERNYAWKEDRRVAAEENAAIPFEEKDTNEPEYDWERGWMGPPIKDQEWVIVKRLISDWTPLRKGGE